MLCNKKSCSGDFFYVQQGAVDLEGFDKIIVAALEAKAALQNGEYARATSEWDKTQKVTLRVTHGIDFYNVLKRITGSGNGFPL